MTGIECLRIGPLLDRRPTSLGDAERLVLERHLQTCAECARAADAISIARELTADTPSIGARRHRKALERAFATSAVEHRPPTAPLGGVVPAIAALAPAAVLLLWLASAGEPHPSVTKAPRDAAEVVLAGDARIDGRAVAVRSTVPPDTRVSTERGGVLALASARVEMAERSAVSWRPPERTLRLESGAVEVYVKPGGGSFRVATDGFVVEVVGTRFRVDADRVAVSAGVVRIVASDGRVIVPALREGESWERETGEPAVAEETPEPALPAAVLVERARAALGAGDVARARSLATAALAQRPPARVAAEAEVLLAECAHAAGETDRAVSLYLRVARSYRSLSAGELALFAAARLRANQGRGAEARELFETYLERYPRGRLRREAEARLQVLTSQGEQR